MRGALLYGTIIAVAALLPLFFMEGTAGAFLPPLALSYVLAVAVSMLVALTVTPALSMLLLAPAPPETRQSPVVLWLRRRYDKMSSRIVPRPAPALAVLGALVVAGVLASPFLNQSLRPSLKEQDVLIHLEAAPGTSLPRMNEVTAQAVDGLEDLPGVRNVSAHVGRAIMSDQIVNVNSGEIWVKVDPSADYDHTVASIEEVVGGYEGLSADVLTYSEKRVTEVLQEADEDVVVRIYGENAEDLQDTAEELQGLLAGIDGVRGPKVELQPEEPTVEVEVDLERAGAFGVKPGDVRRAAATLLSGITVGNLFEEQKVFDVVVWGAPQIRRSESDVRKLLIDTPDGGQVRLGEVADVRVVSNPTVIRHESVSRYVDVTADVAGRDVDEVAADIERALEQVEFPSEHHAELLGGHAERQAARTGLLVVALASAIGVFLLLQAAFTSWRLAVLSFVALPLALVGGVLAALVGGGTIGLGSVAGFVAVLGIAARGSVVLIRRYQQLERHEGLPFGADLVARGTRDRLAPICMTALGTGAVFLPLVLAGDASGLEIVRPMAVVVLGGLVTTTLLNLVVLPAAYLRYGFVAEPDTSGEDLLARIPDDLVRG
jgi:Cu/Ag efflux pump CusA